MAHRGKPRALALDDRTEQGRRRRAIAVEAKHPLDAVAIEHQPDELKGHSLGVSVVHPEPEGQVHLVALGGLHPSDREVFQVDVLQRVLGVVHVSEEAVDVEANDVGDPADQPAADLGEQL